MKVIYSLTLLAIFGMSVNLGAYCVDKVKKLKCSDFSSQAEAQAALKNGGPGISGFYLDRDKDGIACEGLLSAKKVVKKKASK